MNENELSENLKSSAAGVSARADLAEVELGAGRVRSRRRVATGVVAAMLVAGAGGTGFGIGRSLSGDGDTLAAPASASDDAGGAGGLAAADGDEPITPTSDSSGDDATGSGASSGDDAANPVLPRIEGDVAASEVPADVFYGDSYYEPEAMELVYERTLANGVRVRVQRGQSWDNGGWPEGLWQPAAFCWGSAEMRITLDGPDIVDVSGGSFYDELFRGIQFEVTGVGWADGRDMRVVTVQGDPGITDVTVRWADGPTDTAPMVDGLAVLVVDGSQPWEVGYTVDVTDASGTTSLTQSDLEHWNDPEWRAACEEPPPALPDAGEQPADPAAATAAINERFALLWDQEVPSDDKPDDLLDDWTGVAEATALVYEGSLAETAGTASQTIDELVFTSPTDAWFRYTIDTDISFFGDRYGTATLVDGVWQFPRALICQDLGLAGGGCEPWVDNIYPPSWYERYGAPYEECWTEENGTEVCAAEGFDAPPPTIVFGTVPPPIAVPATIAPAPEG